jgi:Cell wall-active antibiotics response LiaF, C-terminal
MANNLLSDDFAAPLGGATTAVVDISSDRGHLTIDGLGGGEEVLATGRLQYFEKQGVPSRTVNTSNGQATLTMKGGGAGQSWFRAPWTACRGAYEWQIHLNPTVSFDITAHTGGGNVVLNLAGIAVTRLSADSGGGNMEVVLPEDAGNLSVTAGTGGGNMNIEIGSGITGCNVVVANSGAGNVVVCVPGGIAASVHATSGLGKVIVDPRFAKMDAATYQSPDYDVAANKVELTLHSGAGNVSVGSK